MSLAADYAQHFRWLWRSSTLRLTLLLSVVFSLGMVLAIILTLTLGRDAILNRVDTTLANLAASLEGDEAPGDVFSIIVRPISQLDGLPREFYRAIATGGGTVSLDDPFRSSEDWRVLIARDSEETPILIAVPLDNSEDALELLGNTLWTTASVVLVFVLAIGLGTGLLAQRRLSKINATLDAMAKGNLQARTGIATDHDDLDALARQLDVTATDLERLVEQTRHLSANLAHDLRTPLARLRARLEMLPDGDERGAALEEASRLAGIFDTIMRLARIETGQGRDGFEPIDLLELTSELDEIFGPVVEESGKTLTVTTSHAGSVLADRSMLVQAAANLIQNAIVHGGDQITLFANAQELGVADNGQGVDPARFGDIVKPMVRLDTARETDGSGLGLALVRAVAERHGADLVLTPNSPQGLRASIKFTDL